MEEVRLDLFKLHDENDKGQGRIKAELNPELKNLLNKLVIDIKVYGKLKFKDIAQKLEMPYYEFWRNLKKTHVPLIILKYIAEMWAEVTKYNLEEIYNETQNKIEFLSYGAGNTYKKVKSINFVTGDLCKIAGSIVADGHLNKKNLNKKQYRIVVRDQFKDNLEYFSLWIKNTFQIDIQPKEDKKQNLWYVAFNNKIIFRYLNRLFNITSGKKYEKVKVPDSIKLSSLNCQRSFLIGVFNFDGGIDHRNGYFDLTTKSSRLIQDIQSIMKRFELNPDYVNDEIDPISKVCKLRIRRREKLKKFVNLFLEPKTTKFLQLYTHLNGLELPKDLEELKNKLNILYPQVRNGITFPQIIETIIGLNTMKKNTSLVEIQKELNRGKTVTYEYLKCLENWGILKSSRNGLYKVWNLNPNLNK